MKTLTVNDIREWHPCYDPVQKGYGSESWTGTILDILQMENISGADRVWCALKSGVVIQDIQEKFIDFCVSRAMAWAVYAWGVNDAADTAAAYAAYAAYAADTAADAANAADTAADAADTAAGEQECLEQVDFLIELLSEEKE